MFCSMCRRKRQRPSSSRRLMTDPVCLTIRRRRRPRQPSTTSLGKAKCRGSISIAIHSTLAIPSGARIPSCKNCRRKSQTTQRRLLESRYDLQAHPAPPSCGSSDQRSSLVGSRGRTRRASMPTDSQIFTSHSRPVFADGVMMLGRTRSCESRNACVIGSVGAHQSQSPPQAAFRRSGSQATPRRL